MSPSNYLLLSALLFTIGAVGVLVRRNAIVVFMCIELMLNAVNLTLVTFSRINGDLVNLIDTVDIPNRQVVIEARIVEGGPTSPRRPRSPRPQAGARHARQGEAPDFDRGLRRLLVQRIG